MAEDQRRKPGYKVCNAERTRRKGLTAETLQELREKGCDKLGIASSNCHVYLDTDGTEVEDDDYFRTLDSQTAFMITSADEVWSHPDEGSLLYINLFSPSQIISI